MSILPTTVRVHLVLQGGQLAYELDLTDDGLVVMKFINPDGERHIRVTAGRAQGKLTLRMPPLGPLQCVEEGLKRVAAATAAACGLTDGNEPWVLVHGERRLTTEPVRIAPIEPIRHMSVGSLGRGRLPFYVACDDGTTFSVATEHIHGPTIQATTLCPSRDDDAPMEPQLLVLRIILASVLQGVMPAVSVVATQSWGVGTAATHEQVRDDAAIPLPAPVVHLHFV